MTHMNESAYIKKLENAGVVILHREPNGNVPGGHIWASRGDRHVRVFFNADDRFYEAAKTDRGGKPLVGEPNLRTMAAVDRHLGI